jgi:hypothetical protein
VSDKKKIMFGEPSTWNNPDGSRMTVDQFMKAQDDYNNDPKLTDALVNVTNLDIPLNTLNPKAIEDRQIKIDAQRELDKDLKQIRDNPVEYVQGKIDLYAPEEKNVDPTTAPWSKQTVDNYENLKKNINRARAMGVLPGPNKKALDQVIKKPKAKTTWQLMLESASPQEKPEYQRILNREYYKRGTKNLSEYELKFINKHPSQMKPKEEVKPMVTPVTVAPEVNIKELIKRRADETLRKQQEAFDKQYGVGGIISLKRPI